MLSFAKIGASTVYGHSEYWSAAVTYVGLNGTAADVGLQDIVVTSLPSGVTVDRVMFIVRNTALYDSSANSNGYSGTQNYRIKPNAGSWGVDDIAALTVDNYSFYQVDITQSAGFELKGSLDIKSVVAGNGTFNARHEDAKSLFATWGMRGLQFGVLIDWHI